MKRRGFFTLIGGAAAAWPLTARGQQPGNLPIIGLLGPTTSKTWSPWVAAFVQRLRDLSWIDGRTVVFEYRYTELQPERVFEMAADLVKLRVNIIVTAGGGVIAAKNATSTIPIVFAVATDPVGAGMVASLARPGANVTGLSLQATDLAGKRLEILKEAVPSLRRVAILGHVGNPASMVEIREVTAASRLLGLDVLTLETRRAEDIAPAIEAIRDQVQALYVVSDQLTATNRSQISALAIGAKLPTIHGTRENVEAGGILSYGPNFSDLFRRAADFVDKILRGTKPGDIPVEQPTKFDLVVNLAAAKALGLNVPPTLLARADEVIE
jgi:putative ABC transport system substrate-binding protein